MLRTPEHAAKFMRRERLAAIATVNAKGDPCLVPVFFTYTDGKVYVQTDRDSAKVRNIRKDNRVAVAVFCGDEAVILRGSARIVDDQEFIVRTQEHIDKYALRIDAMGKDSAGVPVFDSKVRCVLEITPRRTKFW